MSKRHSISACRRGAAVLLLAAILTACSPMVDTRGNLPPAERLAKVHPGKTSRDEVAEALGTPSTLSAFGDPTWYYVSYRTETIAFFSPKEVERTVLAIDFDERGYVKGVRTLGLEDGQVVSFSDRETPTAGKEMNVLQQFLGNIGRFANDGTGDTRMGGSPLPY